MRRINRAGTRVPLSLGVTLSLALASCGPVAADWGDDGEVSHLLESARTQLLESRDAIGSMLSEEATDKLAALRGQLEETAARLGQEHVDELRALLDSEGEGLTRTLDRIEEKGAASWRAARAELEHAADRLGELLDRWAEENARERPDSDGPSPDSDGPSEGPSGDRADRPGVR